MVILPMSDDLRASSSGMDPRLALFRGLARQSCVAISSSPQTNHQRVDHLLAHLSGDRGWFDRADALWARVADPPLISTRDELVLDILRTASVEPPMFENDGGRRTSPGGPAARLR